MTDLILDTCVLRMSSFEDLNCGSCCQDGEMLDCMIYCVDCQEYYCHQCLLVHVMARQEVKPSKSQLPESDNNEPINRELSQLHQTLQNVTDQLTTIKTERLQIIKSLHRESTEIFTVINNFKCQVTVLLQDIENSMTMYVKDLEKQFKDEIGAHLKTLSAARVILATRIKEVVTSQIPMNSFLINTNRNVKTETVIDNVVASNDPIKKARHKDPCNEPRYNGPSNEARCNDLINEPRCNDSGNELRCNDIGNQARHKDPCNEARCNDSSNEPRYNDSGNEPRCNDSGNELRCNDSGNEARHNDPGNEARCNIVMAENMSSKSYNTIHPNIQEEQRASLENELQQTLEDFVYKINKLTVQT